MPISAHTYEHLSRYMGVFAYFSNVVPNIFCIDSQKMSADAQKALGADGYWSRQIINSKPISIQSEDNCTDESEGREVILDIQTLRVISMRRECM